ncbi:synergin gamma-like [Lytechinus pictus]|uniref:synergin gamma-like n=1 Tax=Lytechinus pictus TaxID=7653 RepID=UPI0030BA0F7B
MPASTSSKTIDIKPPYGSLPGGNYRVPGPGGMSNVQGQFTVSTPQQQQQQQSFQMMHQQQLPNPPQTQPQTGRIAPQVYSNQPGGRIYPTPGYNQMLMQPGQFIGQACSGVLQPGINQGFGQQAGIIRGMAPYIQAQQNLTPEQQKKYAEKQKKLLEEQRKKEDQERKERYREEQKRKLKEFSSGGRSSIGSKSLDMGDLLSKSLMTSQQTSIVQTQGMHYQHGMSLQSVSFIPQGQVTPGLGVAQQQTSSVTMTHSQSMDGGFSGFQKAVPLTSSVQQGKEEDFGDFLHAPSDSGSVVTQPGQIAHEPKVETQLSEADDESFGDFLGGNDASQSEQHPDKIQIEIHSHLKSKGSSLENMMMQATDLSESKKERKRFNQKPSLNEVKSSTTFGPKSVTSFTSSNKSRSWQHESEDLSTLFTLPTPAQSGAIGQGDVHVGEAVPQQQTPRQLPAWLQNEASLPVVYHQVLEASSQEGVIQTNLLYPIFLLSGLDRSLLSHIWSVVNYTLPGQLVSQELYIALALIAQAQRGHEVSISALCSVSEAPIPQLNQVGQPPQSQSTLQQPGIASQHQQETDTTTTAANAGTDTAGADVGDVAVDDNFAPFQEASRSTSSTAPTVPAILPSISKFASSSNKSGNKTASTTSSLVIPPSSSSSKTSSSGAYMQG